MKLEWSRFALEDRVAIFDYIEEDNPRAAVAVDERIQNSLEMLVKFPEMGRNGRIEGARELVISSNPYLAAYRMIGDRSASCACPTAHNRGLTTSLKVQNKFVARLIRRAQ